MLYVFIQCIRVGIGVPSAGNLTNKYTTFSFLENKVSYKIIITFSVHDQMEITRSCVWNDMAAGTEGCIDINK